MPLPSVADHENVGSLFTPAPVEHVVGCDELMDGVVGAAELM